MEYHIVKNKKSNGFPLLSARYARVAFTLAEVLITLGIIGVVAALTLPALITNYKKQEIATRLKASQSVISQMLNMSIAEHGDPVNWDFAYVNGTEANSGLSKNLIINLTEKYFLPYLNDTKRSSYMTLAEAGYSEPYHNADGSLNTHNLNALNKNQYVIELANGVSILVYMNSSDITHTLTNILLYIDVNGKRKPNVFGRDTFVAEIKSSSGRFEWLGHGYNRNSLILSCLKSNLSCGELIMHDGWEIKEDYPIKI